MMLQPGHTLQCRSAKLFHVVLSVTLQEQIKTCSKDNLNNVANKDQY